MTSKGVPITVLFGANKIASIDRHSLTIKEYPLPDGGSRPRRIAVSGDLVWYSDYARGRLGRLEPNTGKVTEYPSPGGAQSQPYAITALNGSTDNTNNIIVSSGLGAPITLAGDLPAVQKNVVIQANNNTLDGANQFRGLFIGAWDPGTATQVPVAVTIQDLAITNTKAQGGAGGGRPARRAPRRGGGHRRAREGRRCVAGMEHSQT